MNKNDKKDHRSQKGLIDPNKAKTYLVYHETRLLDFLKEKMTGVSEHNIRSIIANHQVAVGGVPTSLFSFALYPEDEVTVSRTRIKAHRRNPLPIIYEDESIIAVNKPSGLLSVASDREKGLTAYRFVSDYLKSKNKDSRIFVVHRLDEDTSGVLIFAKDYKTREALQNHWQEIVTKRGYYAVVEPSDIDERGHLENYLAEDKAFNMYVTKDKTKGKLAITDYRKITFNRFYALLDIKISTGRKNQIRAQLGHIGHYVVGDDRYGEPSDPIKRLCLHAYELDLSNPLNGKVYKLNCPMPPEFKKLVDKDYNPTPPKKEASKQKQRRRGNGQSKRKKK